MSLTGAQGLVRPYGDTTGDGRVQVSFTLPVPFGDEAERARAEGAALQLAGKMGLDPAMVVHAKGMGPDFTFFIVYGRVSHLVDLSAITVAEREFPVLPAAEVNLRIRSALGRKLVVVGACIGTDAHTVGIDAILNVKGHAGEKGLEYYREIRVVNMGAQVAVPDLVARAMAEHADAVLVSQVVTQRDAHLSNTREMSAAFSGLQRPLLVVGGPRFDPSAAHDLGVDKIFGRGTTPGEVASYLVHALAPQTPSEGAA
jgi:beta-lysine 5,6-aminomutase beta subunit